MNSRAAELDRIVPSLPISESFFEDGRDQMVYGWMTIGEDHRDRLAATQLLIALA